MKGVVTEINANRGMVAVRTNSGDFSIFEMLSSDEIEIHDEISWENDTGLGHEFVKNISKNTKFEVYFQNHHVTKNQLKDQLYYKKY